MDNQVIPPRPPSELEWAADNWPISGVAVDYRQTGTDTAETFITLTGSHGKKTWAASTFCTYFELHLTYNEVVQVKSQYRDMVSKWRDYAKRYARELAEYKRLKAKYG